MGPINKIRKKSKLGTSKMDKNRIPGVFQVLLEVLWQEDYIYCIRENDVAVNP